MSQRRRLRKVAEKAQLSAVMLNAGTDHGCDVCRGTQWRTKLTRHLLSKKMLGDSKTLCTACGKKWMVSLFAAGANQEIHVAFNPIPNEPSN
jgi:hypothetical protein